MFGDWLIEQLAFSCGGGVLLVWAVPVTWLLVCFSELVDDGLGCVDLEVGWCRFYK